MGMIKNKPTFFEEEMLWRKGYRYVAGIDEVGRGCFAGPVVAAGVVFDRENLSQPFLKEIRDSKQLSAEKRAVLSTFIKTHALSYSIVEVSVNVINKSGIVHATHVAFRRVVKTLPVRPDFLLIDAFYIKRLRRRLQKPIVHGDSLSISIAAASILAKVYRDDLMRSLPKKYDKYFFASHKGYGTKLHQAMIKQYGLSDLHRTSFNLQKFL